MRGQRMQREPGVQEAQEEVLGWTPGGGDGGDGDAQETAGEDVDGGAVTAVDEIGAGLGEQEGEDVDGAGGDEVVPVLVSIVYAE